MMRLVAASALLLVACEADALSVCPAPCSNLLVESYEECDDGNLTNGDGCSALCTWESGFICEDGAPTTCTACNATTKLCATATAGDPCLIGIMGDSISDFDFLPEITIWPTVLEAALSAANYDFVNTSTAGQRIEEGRTLQWTNQLDDDDLDALIIFMGTNDIGNGDITSVNYLADVAEVAESARHQGIRVLTVSLIPRAGHGDWTAGKQTLLEEYNTGLAAAATDCRLYVDAYTGMADVDDSQLAIYVFDEIHPNNAGQAYIESLILPLVGP